MIYTNNNERNRKWNLVKTRIKKKATKYWGKEIKELLPPNKRYELYKEAFREKTKRNTKLPVEVLLQIMIKHLGHWDPKRRGAKMPISA